MHAFLLADWHATHGAVFPAEGVHGPLHYGSAASEHAFLQQASALFDASARDRLLVTGDDRLEFIQGLTTNDVEKAAVGSSFEAAFITPKGKLVADTRITRLDDALLFDCEAGRGAALDELFSKYRIHENAEWTDASEQLAALELWGPKSADVLGEGALPEGESRAVVLGENAVLAVGTVFGAVLYVPGAIATEIAGELLGRLKAVGGGLVGSEAVEAKRIELGLGRYGIDWDENTNPLEAGLDRALDYKKGCYVGQEVVAKATYIGHVARRLVRLEWEGEPAAAGTTLLGGKTPGRVTSCARVPGSSRVVALGVVRRESTAAGTLLRLGSDSGPSATVTGYPYRSKDKPV